MEEKINNLLIEIKNIALEKEEYDIILLVNKINDVLGSNYVIYSLDDK